MSRHYSEDDLTLYYYGETRRRGAMQRHLDSCDACRATYAGIAETLAMIAAPEAPDRGEQYGLEVWQRIRHQLPEQQVSWWLGDLFHRDRLAIAAVAAILVVVAFAAGRLWPIQPAVVPPGGIAQASAGRTAGNGEASIRQSILLTAVAEHLDQSERVLTDIMNGPSRGDISVQQAWADSLLATSRLYRQDAAEAGEPSVANVLDEIERSLLEIVHSPSHISEAALDDIRRRIDAAALLFKVRVMSDELRKRESPPLDPVITRASTRTTS